jgi:hypothetical protein
MSSFRHLQTLALFVVVGSVFVLLYFHFTVQRDMSVHQETYISELHAIILELIEAYKLTDPVMALCKTTKARAQLELLSKIVGGDANLTQISGIDVSNCLNVSTYQERQIRKKLHLEVNLDPHPLEPDLVDK